ncbi:MAG: hypothetical protein PHD82_08605 [Candidatus Riflebacteria bacterium]|nr:hypothetical protein [Candidatus Riflebacteria bacterium]
MNRRVLIALILTLAVAVGAQAQSWKIDYGNDRGKVAVFNSKTDPKFAEDAPYGPMSFRIFGQNLWLLDSIGGKLYGFDQKNELKADLTVPGLEGFKLLEDFALVAGVSGQPESVWVADASDCIVRKLSLADGKELLRVGGRGVEPGQFLQIHQLEVDAGGRLYVGDYGRTVISVFTAYGELVREIPWQRSGFALDKRGRLHLLNYSERGGYFHRIYSARGQLLKSVHVGLPDMQNARVWSAGTDDSLLVSFVPAGGFKGSLVLVEISDCARINRRLDLVPPGSMNRFVASANQTIYVAEADFFAAPEGKFAVKTVEWDVTK